MNDFEKVISTCEKQTLCQTCNYYNHNTGACIFSGLPNMWEVPTINVSLKLDTLETPKRKRGAK